MRYLIIILFGVVLLGCDNDSSTVVLETDDINPILQESNSIVEPIQDSTLLFKEKCGNKIYTVWYDSVRKHPNPFGKAVLSVKVETDKVTISEFTDSSNIDFSFLLFKPESISATTCEDGSLSFYLSYELSNDDHFSLNYVICEDDSLYNFEVKWTPDGMYNTLDESVYHEIVQIKALKLSMYEEILDNILKQDTLLNSDWIFDE
jgi:hypothetical protein